MFEESASELRDRLRDAQRNVARLEAENEARADSDANEIASLRDRIADLEFEKAQLQERPPPPPPSPSLDATQRLHALALKDATIADLRKRIESNTDLEELKRSYDEASKAAIRDREAQDATIIDLEKRLASVATERDQIIGDLQRHLAEESTNTLNAVAAQDATIADLRRRLANNTSEGIAERGCYHSGFAGAHRAQCVISRRGRCVGRPAPARRRGAAADRGRIGRARRHHREAHERIARSSRRTRRRRWATSRRSILCWSRRTRIRSGTSRRGFLGWRASSKDAEEELASSREFYAVRGRTPNGETTCFGVCRSAKKSYRCYGAMAPPAVGGDTALAFFR